MIFFYPVYYVYCKHSQFTPPTVQIIVNIYCMSQYRYIRPYDSYVPKAGKFYSILFYSILFYSLHIFQKAAEISA